MTAARQRLLGLTHHSHEDIMARHAPAPKRRIRTISLRNALEELRQPGRELVSLHLPPPEGGHGFFIAPLGARVSEEDVRKILQRPDVQPWSSGLFPDTVQSWRMLHQ